MIKSFFHLMNPPPQIILDGCPSTTIKIPTGGRGGHRNYWILPHHRGRSVIIVVGLHVAMMTAVMIHSGIVVVVVAVSLPPPLDHNNYYSKRERFEKYPPTCE